MITILDYISANKAKVAAEAGLFLLGLSGAVWLITSKGINNITLNTSNSTSQNIEQPEAILTGPEGAGTGYVWGTWDLIPARGLNEREKANKKQNQEENPDTLLPTDEAVGWATCQSLAQKLNGDLEKVLATGRCVLKNGSNSKTINPHDNK